MNAKQKKTIQWCMAVAVLMFVFPPLITQLPEGAASSEGFGFIFSPAESTITGLMAVVNVWQLLAQWILVAGIGATFYWIQAGEEPPPKSIPVPPDLLDAIEREAEFAKQKARRTNLLKQVQGMDTKKD